MLSRSSAASRARAAAVRVHRWSRVAPLVALGTLFGAVLAPAAPSAAATPAAPRWASGAAQVARAHALADRSGARPLAAATPLSTNSNICWTQTHNDTAGDASTLDIIQAELEYDCASKNLTVVVTTRDAFATPQVHDFFGAFDIDADASTGCGGSDLYADAAWVPDRNQMLAAVFTVTSCSATPDLKEFLAPKRYSAHSIALTFDPSAYFPHLNQFSWGVLTAPDPDNFDVVGNGSLMPASIPNFPPSGSTAFSMHTPSQIGGAFTDIIPGKFSGGAATDLILYRAGSGADALWTNLGNGTFSSTPLSINGTYTQIVPGDFNHDGHTDLLFYLAGPKQDFIWFGNGSGGFTSHPFTINGSYHVVPGDYNADGYTDLLFYAPGTAHDYIWTFHNGGFTSAPFTINGSYQITPGDFNGDGRTDLLFYAPGTAPDYIWDAHAVGSGVEFGSHAYPINDVYTHLYAGNFGGGSFDDVFLWSRGWGPDSLLRGQSGAPFLTKGSQIVINEFYDKIVVGDFNGDGKADLFLISYGTGADQLWEGV
jgi:hypothetical protein